MIDLMKLSASEAERLAYVEGFAGVGELLARLSDAEYTLSRYEAVLEAIADSGRLRTMTAKQCAAAAHEVLP